MADITVNALPYPKHSNGQTISAKGAGVKDTDVAPANVDVTRDAIQVHGGYVVVRELTADGETNHLESTGAATRLAKFTSAPTRFSYRGSQWLSIECDLHGKG